MAKHKSEYVGVIIATFIFLGINIFLQIMAFEDSIREGFPDLFPENYYEVMSDTTVEIMSADWAFWIWVAVNAYQVMWVLYTISLICRKTNDWQGYLYYRPAFMPISIYIVFWIALLLQSLWGVLFARRMLVYVSPIMFVVSFMLYIALIISYRALNKEGDVLLKTGHKREIIMVRLFVQNGLAASATYATLGALLRFAQVLTYSAYIDQENASTVAICLAIVELIGFYFIDNFMVERYSRYTFMPYMVFIAVVASVLDFQIQYDLWLQRNSIITAVALGLGCFAFLFKMIMSIKLAMFEPEPILRETS